MFFQQKKTMKTCTLYEMSIAIYFIVFVGI